MLSCINVHAALLLLLLFFVCSSRAVCRHCWGTIPGCTGTDSDDNCTSLTGVAGNVAALITGSSTALSCAGLLPVYLLRVFTRRVLDTLATLSRRGSGATPYDFTGKAPDVVIRAVSDRVADADDAITHLGIVAATDGTSDALRSRCVAAVKVIESLRAGRVGVVGSRVDFGKYLYIFGMCQQYINVHVGDSVSLVADALGDADSHCRRVTPIALAATTVAPWALPTVPAANAVPTAVATLAAAAIAPRALPTVPAAGAGGDDHADADAEQGRRRRTGVSDANSNRRRFTDSDSDGHSDASYYHCHPNANARSDSLHVSSGGLP